MYMPKIIIYRCGGHARSIVDVIKDKKEWKEKFDIILVDSAARENEKILECAVIKEYFMTLDDYFLVGLGDNWQRQTIFNNVLKENSGFKPLTVTADTARIGIGSSVGAGSCIMQKAYVGPSATIGSNVIINTAAVVEHEVHIGNHTHIAPNATVCGRSRIGERVLVGAGSVVIDNITICSDTVIGAGSVVNKNITESGVYAGTPVRKIRDVI